MYQRYLPILILLVVTSPVLAVEAPAKAAIVPIDLEKTVIRVAASPDHVYPHAVLAEVGFCKMLTQPLPTAPKQVARPGILVVREEQELIDSVSAGFTPVDYVTVATKLTSGDEVHGAFKAGITDATVGVWIKRLDRRDQALIEIRPMYILPSGKKLSFNRRAGMGHLRSINRALAKAQAAKAAIPKLETDIRTAKDQYEQQSALARRGGLRVYASNVPNPRAQAQAAYNTGVVLTKQLAKAKALAAQLPALEKDAKALLEVAQYGAAIAPEAKIYVRMYTNLVDLDLTTY